MISYYVTANILMALIIDVYESVVSAARQEKIENAAFVEIG
jgi:hypothetical protein